MEALRQIFIDGLSEKKQFKLAIKLLKLALPIWEKYASNNKLFFFHSHNNKKHTVSINLLNETIEYLEEYNSVPDFQTDFEACDKLLDIQQKFLDPEEAILNSDWVLPEQVYMVYQAVYIYFEIFDNVFLYYHDDDVSITASINQAINALIESETLTEEQIDGIIYTT